MHEQILPQLFQDLLWGLQELASGSHDQGTLYLGHSFPHGKITQDALYRSSKIRWVSSRCTEKIEAYQRIQEEDRPARERNTERSTKIDRKYRIVDPLIRTMQKQRQLTFRNLGSYRPTSYLLALFEDQQRPSQQLGLQLQKRQVLIQQQHHSRALGQEKEVLREF